MMVRLALFIPAIYRGWGGGGGGGGKKARTLLPALWSCAAFEPKRFRSFQKKKKKTLTDS